MMYYDLKQGIVNVTVCASGEAWSDGSFLMYDTGKKMQRQLPVSFYQPGMEQNSFEGERMNAGGTGTN